MKAEEFLSELYKQTPSKAVLLRNDFSPEQADEIVKSYKAAMKVVEKNNQYGDNLLELVEGYDCSNIELGLIKFNYDLALSNGHIVVGTVEADLLTLNQHTGEICIVDQENTQFIVTFCAKNGDKFLDALLEFATFLNMRFENKALFDDANFTKRFVLSCSEKAGGDKYLNFYKMLLGDFD